MSTEQLQKMIATAVANAVNTTTTTTKTAEKPAAKSNGFKGNERYNNIVAFAHKAIKALRAQRDGKYGKGVHCRFDGFNTALAAKFDLDSDDLRTVTDLMVENGDLEMRPCKGGVRFYLPGELSRGSTAKSADSLLKTIAAYKG